MNELLAAALEYLARDWSVFPIEHLPSQPKHPMVRWKPLQLKRPTERQLQKWFAKSGVAGIAVILGEISGGLCCRDFDMADAYERWAHEHSDLADQLPTSTTGRGHHVWFNGPVPRVIHLGDGEIRGGSGSICVLPPSGHPSGQRYEWLNRLPNGPMPYIFDPAKVGLSGPVASEEAVTERGSTIASVLSVSSVLSVFSVTPEVEEIIASTLPTEQGQRNRRLFELTRALKSRPEFADADSGQFRDIVKAWHKAALPMIGTKDFETTWFDFTYAWYKVKYPIGQGPMAEIFSRACAAAPPIAADRYELPKVKLLVSLCRELQRSAVNDPFYLSCRTAGQLLGVDHMTASRWIQGIIRDRVIIEVEKGGGAKNPRRASRYQWVAD